MYLDTYPPQFDEFCEAYPKHVEKARAYPPWKHLITSLVEPEILITAAHSYADFCSSEQREDKHIALAQNWLKDKWRDYLGYKARAGPVLKAMYCPKCGMPCGSAGCRSCGWINDELQGQ